MDRNRDGLVSRGEWKGSGRTFERTDTNRGGALTRDEYLRQRQVFVANLKIGRDEN